MQTLYLQEWLHGDVQGLFTHIPPIQPGGVGGHTPLSIVLQASLGFFCLFGQTHVCKHSGVAGAAMLVLEGREPDRL